MAVLMIISFQSTALNAQKEGAFLNASIGYGGERDMNIPGCGTFKSNNTISFDFGGGGYYSVLGFAAGIGIKSMEFTSASSIMNGASRKGSFELSIGPALCFGTFPPFPGQYNDNWTLFGLMLSAQPSYCIAALMSPEDDFIVGSWGVKLTADLRIWYLTFGVSYNPFDLKLYKSNTNTNLFSPGNQKLIYAKPALEFRVGIIFGDVE